MDLPILIDAYFSWIGAAIGAAAGLVGAKMQASSAKSAASRQMDFQRDMSDTSYQRSMADMEKAGLNPILAYQKGGASTPTGASYQPPNMGQAAMSGASSAASIQNTRASTDNLREQNENLKTQNVKILADTAKTHQDAMRVQLENEAYSKLSPSQRLLYLSANPVSSAAGAASNLFKLFKKGR